jgi:hypothetical protein
LKHNRGLLVALVRPADGNIDELGRARRRVLAADHDANPRSQDMPRHPDTATETVVPKPDPVKYDVNVVPHNALRAVARVEMAKYRERGPLPLQRLQQVLAAFPSLAEMTLWRTVDDDDIGAGRDGVVPDVADRGVLERPGTTVGVCGAP